ncbi:MAG TPA: OmpA family protein [Leptospiraceae bacterium]|nr:OmpA family protein [Leptospiraceae bacterium]HMW04554.1 OmpA family protein [Leptospiraceae bacterium]HMX33451.1 OmpA family protein [Leptospiraceae bacterium]HMY30740.1 OmpA family protein [Leptospiraceae bacterium]HMZ64318.1 OmpA family protein [Leptospiraceae bacterium]
MSYKKIFLTFFSLITIESLQSVPEVKVIPIPGNINTEMQEFAPSLTSDGKTMYFYSKRNNSKYTDLYKSSLINGRWTNPIDLRGLNSAYDDQSPFISEDEKFIVFSSNRDGSIEFQLPSGKIGVSRDLYYSENINGKWSKPSSLSDKINTEEMEENPFLHESDFYFTRYPFGNPSEAKIWKAKIIGNHLQEPEELPSPINLEGTSNIAAVISKDGKYIYFASNRPGGYGGYDIYRSKINKDGSYTDPENLGPEINTQGDEAYMVIDKANNAFYFCRKNLNESYDIYTALILKDEEEAKVATKENPIRDKSIEETKINPPKDKIEIPSVVELPKKEIPKKDDVTQTLKEKKKLTLNNVLFDTNSSELLSESFPVLNQIVDFLKEHPDTKIKITGHTDLTGDTTLNKILSLERAESVRTYLHSKGIERKRMIADGKGSTQPLINNVEPESNRVNRRTEFQIVD